MTTVRSADLRSMWESLPVPLEGGVIATVPSGVITAAGEVVMGRDTRGNVHLLVPVGSGDVPTDNRSRGVILIGQPLDTGGTDRLYADLVCVEPGLIRVFAEFCADVLERLPDLEDEYGAAGAIARMLDEWRELLRAAPAPELGPVVGLVGELEVLERIARVAPERALDLWGGSAGDVYDFQGSGDAIEVKTSTSHEGLFVEIHGPDQLDPPPDLSLYLHYVRVREDAAAPTLAERISGIVDLGVPWSELRRSLVERGLSTGGEWERRRYRVVETRTWEVDAGFPGVRRSGLAPSALNGVDRLTYRLDLAAGGQPLAASEVEAVIDRLVRGVGR